MLGALLAMLRRRKMPLVLSATLIPLLAFIAICQTTPRYTATCEVIYDPNSSYAARELQSILRSDPTTDAVMASQIEILQGLRMAERLTERFELARDPEFNTALLPPSFWRSLTNGVVDWVGGRTINPESERQAVLRAVQQAIGAKTVKTSRVIEVSFTSTNPMLAADAANALINLYLADQLALKADAVRHANEWLDGQVGELRREVREAEDRICRLPRAGVTGAGRASRAGHRAGKPSQRRPGAGPQRSGGLAVAPRRRPRTQHRTGAGRDRTKRGRAALATGSAFGPIQSLLARLGPKSSDRRGASRPAS